MAPCGCGGSSQQTRPPEQQQASRTLEGGPGHPSYTWNGPKTAPAAPKK